MFSIFSGARYSPCASCEKKLHVDKKGGEGEGWGKRDASELGKKKKKNTHNQRDAIDDNHIGTRQTLKMFFLRSTILRREPSSHTPMSPLFSCECGRRGGCAQHREMQRGKKKKKEQKNSGTCAANPRGQSSPTSSGRSCSSPASRLVPERRSPRQS